MTHKRSPHRGFGRHHHGMGVGAVGYRGSGAFSREPTSLCFLLLVSLPLPFEGILDRHLVTQAPSDSCLLVGRD